MIIIAITTGGLTKKGELDWRARWCLFRARKKAQRLRKKNIPYCYLTTPGRRNEKQNHFQRPCDMMVFNLYKNDASATNVIVPDRGFDLVLKQDIKEFVADAAKKRKAKVVWV